MKKILVPCDFSNTAVEAFNVAREITADKGEAFLRNIVELPACTVLWLPCEGI